MPVNVNALRKLTGCRPIKFPHPQPSPNAALSKFSHSQHFPSHCCLRSQTTTGERDLLGVNAKTMEVPFRNPFLKPGFKIYRLVTALNYATHENLKIMIDNMNFSGRTA